MRYNKVRFSGLADLDLNLLGASPSDRLHVRNISGLGMSDTDVYISTAGQSEGFYTGQQRQLKELVFLVALNPDWFAGERPGDLREEMYKNLRTRYGGPLTVKLMQDDQVVAQIQGVVKRIEPSIFSRDPEVQITISTMSPFFTAPSAVTLSGLPKTEFTINNPGSAAVGFHMELTFTANMAGGGLSPNPSLVLRDLDAVNPTPHYISLGATVVAVTSVLLGISYPFLNGDVLKIDTRPKYRSVSRVRSGVELNLAGYIQDTSTWLELAPGENRFRLSVPSPGFGGTTETYQSFNWGPVYFTPQYEGV